MSMSAIFLIFKASYLVKSLRFRFTCSPICQRREGGISDERLAFKDYIGSEFLERNSCEAFCQVIYAMIIISQNIWGIFHFYKFCKSYIKTSKNKPFEILTGMSPL